MATVTKKTRRPPAKRPAPQSRLAWKSYAAGSELNHFAEFCREHLRLSKDRWVGQPLELEPFQRRMMGEALAFDEDGWPVWTSVVIVLPRKNGKTNLLAAYAIYRLVTSDDNPEILLAASSDKQADRLYQAAAAFVRRSPDLLDLCRVRDYTGEIVREDAMGTINRVASDPKRLHGYDPSLVICDELGQWTTPSLEKAFAALTSGDGARGAPQLFSITVAGEASTRHASILGRLLDAAEKASDRVVKPGLEISRVPESKMLVYNYTAPTTDPFETRKLKLANPASWITEAYLLKKANNPELTDADVLQLHGCVWAAANTTFIAPEAVQGALRRGADLEIEDDDDVVLGFDGSETRDETWLVAANLDGLVQPLARWQRPPRAGEHWRIPRREVDDAIEAAFERFNVLELAADPPGWYREVDDWRELYGEEVVVDFETRQPSRMAPACERLQQGVLSEAIAFCGPLAHELAIHVDRCVTRPTPYGIVVSKDHPDSPRKIDGAVASAIAVDRAAFHAGGDGEDFAFVLDPNAVPA